MVAAGLHRFALLGLVLAACSSGTKAKAPASSATAPGATNAAAGAPGDKDATFGLGFVLLAKAELPDAAAVMREYQRLAPDGPALGDPDAKDGVMTFKHGTAFATVGLMAMAVPNGEAEYHAKHSLLMIAGSWKPAPQTAHLIVATMNAGATPLERTRTTHRLLAAVAAAAGSNAVGVYIGNAGVTHEPAFYVDAVAQSPEPIIVWSGVSVARDGERFSYMTTGMQKQLGLPDIELTAGTTAPGEALAALYDLALYVAKRGEAIPDGDTVGQSEEQRIRVRYVPSPAGTDDKVMRVDYP